MASQHPTPSYPPPKYTPQQSSFPPPRPHGLTSHPAGGSSPSSWRQKQTPRGISRGLAVCLVVVLFLTVLMISQADPLAPLIDVDSATRHASTENSTLIIEREKTEREREAMAREKELWEKAKENRIPLGAFWDAVWPAWDCRAYGRREYWGVLKNIPKDWTPMDACMNMPVEIKGVTVRRPQRCAYVWGSPHIQGYWMVDWDQPDCKPWYRDYRDVGCTGFRSGKRKIEAQIVGINNRKEQDWRLLCSSTPLVWDRITYKSPTYCEERGWGRKVATWDVPDESCS